MGERRETSRAKTAVSRLARRVPCPSCGYEVTTRATKRVKHLHHRPDGTVCPQEQWYVAQTKLGSVFEGCPVGVGAGGGWMAVPKKGRVGLGWQFQKEQVQERVGLVGWQFRREQGLGESKGFGSGGVGVLFFTGGGVPGEGWRVDLVQPSRFASCCMVQIPLPQRLRGEDKARPPQRRLEPQSHIWAAMFTVTRDALNTA